MTLSQYSINEIAFAISKCFSLAQVLRLLDISPHGGVYKQLKTKISQNRIDISHFTGQSWSKDLRLVTKVDINDYLFGKRKINTHQLKLRLIRDKIFEHKCYSCGLVTWKDSPIPIELHHIDGNNKNNSLENLQILCPNCHAQTDNHAGKKLKNKTKKDKTPRKRTKVCLCGNPIISTSKQCRECKNIESTKNRPSSEELIETIKTKKTISLTSRHYGVSRETITNWCKKYSIDYKSLLK